MKSYWTSIQVLKNKLANEFWLERQNADIEEISFRRGALAKAVKEGDADWGHLCQDKLLE